MSNRGEDTFWTGEKQDGLRGMWPSNRSVAEIARKLGCSKGAAAGKARRMGLPEKANPRVTPRRPSAINNPQILASVIQMIEAGTTRSDAAARAGISTSTLGDILRSVRKDSDKARRPPRLIKVAPRPKPRPPPPPPPPRPAPDSLPPAASGRTRQCAWIDGEGRAMRQCEAPTNGTYCPEHAAKVYRPQNDKNGQTGYGQKRLGGLR